ncbi:MAG TPA: hypothetical protein DC009_05510 [Porphyromonadaceae bacterium]|nr:hypothetical protein [Porphyromonadaceae bacterium]
MKTEETQKTEERHTGSARTCATCGCKHPGLCNVLKDDLYFSKEEVDVLRKALDEKADMFLRAEEDLDDTRDLLPTRAELHKLYQSISQSLEGWGNMGRHIKDVVELAYTADESGGSVIHRVAEIELWADAIIDQANKRPAALDMIEVYSNIVFGDSEFLLDDTDD